MNFLCPLWWTDELNSCTVDQDDRWPTWLMHSTCDFVLRPPWKRKRRVNRGFGAAGAYPCQQLTDWMSTMNFTIPQFHSTISEVRDGKERLITTRWCRTSTLKILAWLFVPMDWSDRGTRTFCIIEMVPISMIVTQTWANSINRLMLNIVWAFPCFKHFFSSI